MTFFSLQWCSENFAVKYQREPTAQFYVSQVKSQDPSEIFPFSIPILMTGFFWGKLEKNPIDRTGPKIANYAFFRPKFGLFLKTTLFLPFKVKILKLWGRHKIFWAILP